MALFKVLRGPSNKIKRDADPATKQPFVDGYAYFTPDDGRFYIDVQLDSAPNYWYDSGIVNGKTIYRIEIEYANYKELLEIKSDVGHHHNMSDINDGVQGVYFVKGTQTAATASWTGNLPTINALYDGLTIAYYLPVNSGNNVTLTLTLKNSTTAAEPVYWTGTSRMTTHYGAGSVVLLTWVSNATSGYAAVGSASGRWMRADYNTDNIPASLCATAAATAAKAASHSYYTVRPNSYTLVTMRYANTAANALTLNINGQGAKPIYINGTASSASNYTLPAGTYLVFYDGTNYYFRTDGLLTADITGDANTVGGFTVASNVPAGAKFTDTTYTVNTDSGLSMNGTQIAINKVPVSKGGTGQSTLASGQVLVGNGTNAVTTRPIDNTDGGTADSTALITSGAVEAGLASKSNTGHHHNINEIDDIAFTSTYNKTTNKIVTQDTLNSAIDEIDAESLGLSKAMRFIGKATVTISDGDRTNPAITGYDFGTNGANAKLGDVIIDKDGLYEYVWTANGWELLGGDSSYIISGSKIKYTPTGTISPNPPTFTGSSKSISVSGTPTGSVTVNIGTNVSGTSYTPAGSVGQPTFTGTEATISMSGTPTGTVAITSADATGTDNGNYQPKGSVSKPTFTGTKATWNIDTTPSGSVNLTIADSTTGNYQPKGDVSQPTFTGTNATITVKGTPSGSVSATANTSGGFQPGGTISAQTFTGTKATITVTGTPTGGVNITTANDSTNAGNYTPSGTVSKPTFTGTATSWTIDTTPAGTVSLNIADNTSGNYQPKGTVSKPTFTGTEGNISVSGTPTGSVSLAIASDATNGNYTPTGTVSKPSFTGTATTLKATPTGSIAVTATANTSGNYQPSGTVSKPSFTGTEATIVVSGGDGTITYTPAGSVTKPNITVTPTTGKTYSITGVGSVPSLSMAVTDETLTYSWNAGSVPTREEKTFMTGATAALAAAPTFSGTGTRLTATYTPAGSVSQPTFTGNKVQLGGTFSGSEFSISYTPTGSVSQPTFTGDKIKISSTFTGNALTSTGKFTPVGTVSQPTFTGTKVQITPTFSGTENSETISYTPTGSISQPTFTGNKVKISGSFTGSALTSTGEYTPVGSISQAIFTGSKYQLSFTGNELTSTGSYKPTGTVSKPTFTGTKAQFTALFSGTESSETIEYTPAGTISQPTFTGTKARISGSFTGSLLSLSTNYTPAGTVSKPSWTGTATKIGASFTGSALTSTGSYKPEGTISELTFVGTQKEITLTANSVN